MRDRIIANVEPEPNSGCWLWTAGLGGSGYGALRYGTPTRAHRVSYMVFVGPITDGLFVCHRCDTPLCVNPDHLFLGTAKDNAVDAMRKGRLCHQHQTHCANGHERTPENVHVFQRKRSTVTLCKICCRVNATKSQRKMRARKRLAA